MYFVFFLTGSFLQVQFTRMHIFELWHLAKGSQIEKYRIILEKVLEMVPEAENVEIEALSKRVSYIIQMIADYWKKAARNKYELVRKHAKWLNVLETIDIAKNESVSARENQFTDQEMTSNLGRPKKDFESCSKRTQRRRLVDLSKIDNSAVSALINTSSTSSGPNDSHKCEVNPSEVLSLITEAKLTKHQYLVIKEFINSKQYPVLPSYHKVLEAKKQCYPEKLALRRIPIF